MGTKRALHDFGGDLTHEVIGAYYQVFNALPRGLLESAYAGALYLELLRCHLPVEREVPLRVYYRDAVVGCYRADLLVAGRLILELKTVGRLREPETKQIYHYLRVTRLPLGLLLNFGQMPQVVRVINTHAD